MCWLFLLLFDRYDVAGRQLQSQYDWPEYLELLTKVRASLSDPFPSPPPLVFVATDDKNATNKLPSNSVLPAIGNMLFTTVPAAKVALSRWGEYSRQDESAYLVAQNSGGDVAFEMVTEAIADIYLLSRASVFVGSISSTFGTVASQCGLQSRGPGGTAKKVYYIDGADVASGRYKCSVTSYMLLSGATLAEVSYAIYSR